jgi:hypothetical protein
VWSPFGIEVIKIMEMVQPELILGSVVPMSGLTYHPFPPKQQDAILPE